LNPEWYPEAQITHWPGRTNVVEYGMTTWGDLFTTRQLIALTIFSDLVAKAWELIKQDSLTDTIPQRDATSYANAVDLYLGLSVSKASDLSSTVCHWQPNPEHLKIAPTFSRHAIPMSWDFAEGNPFSQSSGNFSRQWELIEKVLGCLTVGCNATVNQHDAAVKFPLTNQPLVSTDPPYYSNIGYSGLSDFFYVWLRRSIGNIYSELFSTLLTPKALELVADPYKFEGDKKKAQTFFEGGLKKVFDNINGASNVLYPVTIYYAFKQSETDGEEKVNGESVTASTGWETMLEALIQSEFSINGTWPMRTERSVRSISYGANALASSIVLVCRPRPADAPSTTRRRFVDELKSELPDALKKLQQGNIAPVDLAQASIGPGIAIFSRYAKVLESDGLPMRVRTALQLINQTLDEFLTEQEGELDTDTRWALAWFEQYQFNEGQFGNAETLSKAKNTSIKGMAEAGILTAKAGKVQLIPRKALPTDWNPTQDSRIPVWEATQHLIQTLDQHGENGAAHLLLRLNISNGDLGEVARDLAYRLYSICDRKGWTQEAIAYNSLVISWAEISRLALEKSTSSAQPIQGNLEL